MLENLFLYKYTLGSFRITTMVCASITCFFLGSLAYWKNKGSPINRSFALFNLFLGAWNFATLFILLSDLPTKLYIHRTANLLGTFVVPTFYTFALEISGRPVQPPWQRRLLWSSTLLMAILAPTRWIISGMTYSPYPIESPGPLFPLFSVYLLGWTCWGCVHVFRAFLNSSGARKNQLRYILLSLAFLYLAAGAYVTNTLFPPFPPVYYVPEIFANITLAYAIVRYRLLDINLVFRYGTVYSLLALVIGAPFALWIGGWTGHWGAGLIGFFAPLSGYFLAEKLMPALTQIIDHLPVFRGRYENFRDLKRQESYLRGADSMEDWQHRLTTIVDQTLHAQNTRVVQLDPNQPLDPNFTSVFSHQHIVLRDYLDPDLSPITVHSVRKTLETLKTDLLIPLASASGKIHALLCLGPKRDGNIWNDLDLTALWTLARVGEETLRDIQRRESLEQQKRLAALGEMASVVSHEIKTPLAVIQNSMAFLTDRLPPSPDDKVRKHVDIIASQTQSLTSIITGILDYARQRELNLEPGDLNALLRELTGTLSPPENVQMVLNLAEDLPKILFDKEEMKQALRNVIQNGIQAMPQGGKLTIATAATPTEVTVSISDTGVGIEEKDFPHLFEPFYTTKTQGTGLGLAVVKKVMDRHKGHVTIKSAPGLGTSLDLHLPSSPQTQHHDRMPQ